MLAELLANDIRAEVLTLLVGPLGRINRQLRTAKFKDQGQFRPWDTVNVLAAFLKYNMTDATRNIAECVGLPALSGDMKSVRVTTATFNIKWQNILDKLQGGLKPYVAFVESLCGGKLLQKCFGCSEEVTVADVKVEMSGNEVEGPVLVFSNIILSLCGKTKCYKSRKYLKIEEENDNLGDVYNKLGSEFARDMCDYCSQYHRGVRGHRCSQCLTKVYCGVGCKDKDWETVHHVICRKGEESRKKKMRKDGRKLKGNVEHEQQLAVIDN